MCDFRTLSPLDFEELARDLIQAELNLRCESFGPGRDLGIDFRFSEGSGCAIIQAKHYVGSGADALLTAARKENVKIAKLSPQRYILVTSVSLTPAIKTRLRQALSAAPPIPEDILGQADLNNLLGRHPEIERKHFKLWLASTTVLERILHSGVYNRTDAEMDIIKEMIPKFVPNNSVQIGEEMLAKHGALIVSGEPGVGKSTLARMLIWLHAANNWRIFVVDDMKEAFEVANTNEKRLIFFDDFLGQVRLSDDLIRGMDQRFPPFLRRVRMNKNLRFVLTTRDYIFRQAQAQSGRLDSAEVNASEIVLNVGHYTRAARARMLFNHIYFSTLSKPERDALLEDDFFLKMIDHRNFNPRLIDLLTRADYVSVAGVPIRQSVQAVLENPQELWEKPYRAHISAESRALLLALFFNRPRIGFEALERSFVRMVDAVALPIARSELPMKFRNALKELEGSFLAIQGREVRLSNPGVRDYLRSAISEDRFLVAAVGVLAEFSEIGPAWRDFLAEKPRPDYLTAFTWRQAADRLMKNRSGSPLERLDLLLEMYDCLHMGEFIELVRAAVRELSESGVGEDEDPIARKALEALALSALPNDLRQEAIGILSGEFARALAENGWIQSLDDLRASAAVLVEFGTSLDETIGLIQEGIESYVEIMTDHLDQISSREEIEAFESDLFELLDRFKLSRWNAERKISNRKEAIRRHDEEIADSYNGDDGYLPPTHKAETTDTDIRSMFDNLRSN